MSHAKRANRQSLWRGIRVALVVGTLLTAINHGDVLLRGELPAALWKIPLTYLVPFLVSWYASYSEKKAQRDGNLNRLEGGG